MSAPADPPVKAAASAGMARGCTCGCGGCVVVLLFFATLVWATHPGFGILLLLLALAAIALAVYGNLLAQQKETLDASLVVAGDTFRFGEKLKATATITAKRECPLGSGYLALRCIEKAVNRSGTSDTTYTHTAYEERFDVDCGSTLPPGASWSASTEFRLPEGWPASFQGKNNSITWQVHLELSVPGPRLDVRINTDITVLPETI